MFPSWKNLGQSLQEGLTHLLFPTICWVCEQPMNAADGKICSECFSTLVQDSHPTCPRCATSVGPFVDLRTGCIHCRDVRFHFEGVLRLGPYEGLLRDVILKLKHSSGEALAEVIGDMWAGHSFSKLKDFQADMVVPVPLHWLRRLVRGYNQSETLAQAIAKKLSLPCRTFYLKRVRNTPHQTRLTRTQRQENVKHAFRVRRWVSLKEKRILLIDDVLTTGSTASEAARALKDAGAAQVFVAVLAHAK